MKCLPDMNRINRPEDGQLNSQYSYGWKSNGSERSHGDTKGKDDSSEYPSGDINPNHNLLKASLHLKLKYAVERHRKEIKNLPRKTKNETNKTKIAEHLNTDLEELKEAALRGLKYMEDTSLHVFLTNFEQVVCELKAVGGKMENNEAISQMLSSMPESYQSITTAIDAQREQRQDQEVTSDAVFAGYKRHGMKNLNNRNVNKEQDFPFRCHNCGEIGPKRVTCRKPQQNLYRKNVEKEARKGTPREEAGKPPKYLNDFETSIMTALSAENLILDVPQSYEKAEKDKKRKEAINEEPTP
ncbi:hypothetical protein ILUMI_16393 [Ignelater luminosus]|uniref:CCHC-type domain-containing protein n=1 Tax=Ignelater luminosus TaxID=2038154 RepID=A0A8K0CRC6_IGNLU|nr:hypothetical protein ILUMI_16393 [Ignelater luminosus]